MRSRSQRLTRKRTTARNRLLGLPGAAHIVMVIAAGKRAEGGVAPLYRFDRNLYVQHV